ncbi:hypothetical protein HPB48_011796 [Haemaphysalis longicornis]|uniref:Uncharacterized protein n=1 Tax=Haemaphysalis longicornis TaxID=44386 RepID=A0A9J6FRR0_HAELO|nr:hypothetical protein HPB48_011796 [Haemaphysalis longicornis]
MPPRARMRTHNGPLVTATGRPRSERASVRDRKPGGRIELKLSPNAPTNPPYFGVTEPELYGSSIDQGIRLHARVLQPERHACRMRVTGALSDPFTDIIRGRLVRRSKMEGLSSLRRCIIIDKSCYAVDQWRRPRIGTPRGLTCGCAGPGSAACRCSRIFPEGSLVGALESSVAALCAERLLLPCLRPALCLIGGCSVGRSSSGE